MRRNFAVIKKRGPGALSVIPVLLLAGPLLAGCVTPDAVVFKMLAGEIPGERGTIPNNVARGPIGLGPPGLGITRFRKDRQIAMPGQRGKAVSAEKRPETTTAIAAEFARRNDALRAQIYRHDDELQLIRRSIKLHQTAYWVAIDCFGLAKKRRLPEADADFRANMSKARRSLGRLNGNLLKLNALAARIDATAMQTGKLLAAVRAAKEGTLDAVEQRELKVIEAAALRTNALPPKMLAAIYLDIRYQGAYAQKQSRGLDELAEAVDEDAGKPTSRVRQLEAPNIVEIVHPGANVRQAEGKDSCGVAGTVESKRAIRPLIRIRFTNPDVDYKSAVYGALQAALKQRPDLAFEVVGVAPNRGRQESAFNRAQEVRFAMADMGVPPERISLRLETNSDAKSDEVRIFVR